MGEAPECFSYFGCENYFELRSQFQTGRNVQEELIRNLQIEFRMGARPIFPSDFDARFGTLVVLLHTNRQIALEVYLFIKASNRQFGFLFVQTIPEKLNWKIRMNGEQ